MATPELTALMADIGRRARAAARRLAIATSAEKQTALRAMAAAVRDTAAAILTANAADVAAMRAAGSSGNGLVRA